MKKTLYNEFDTIKLNADTEGILWIELYHKSTKESLKFCVCYLPPSNSTRAVNAEEFFHTLMYHIYEYQANSLVTVFGDFNARVGDQEDFIAGVDTIPMRNIVDYGKNQYCELFIDFLISTNMCILNGRNSKNNNFTSVSTKGCSVVDYVLVPYECLDRYNKFEVLLATNIVDRSVGIQSIENISIPDHSILRWEIVLKTSVSQSETNENHNEPRKTYIKYDRQNVPEEFMCSDNILSQINHLIVKLEQNQNEQTYVDSVYNSFTKVIEGEMNKHLKPRTIILDGIRNKKRRVKKPWWDEELKVLWNDLCTYEKTWLKCKNSVEKSTRKHLYVEKRKQFDRCVQRRKRQYWVEKQNELLHSCENSDIFWKTIGKTGIGNERNNVIPMEIVEENGEILRSKEDVLSKWKTDFSKLYNPPYNSDVHNSNDDDILTQNGNEDNDMLNRGITILDVRKAVKSLHRNKAVGNDNMPAEVLQSDTCIHFLHRLFCVCFETGKIPEAWEYGVITPLLKDSSSDPRYPMNYRGITVTSSAYKAYCSILNQRLTLWAEGNDKLTDFQNGFREKRNTIDHLSTVTSIIENRKAMKKSTFLAFVDFSKAYDTINRDLLWTKLKSYGINGKMFRSLRSIYSNVKCTVKVNDLKTDWFEVRSGLKQGCILSTLMFNLYINDLSDILSKLNKGILIQNSYINHLFYADDLVLMAENENDLQCLLDILSNWGKRNCMRVNLSKTKIIHFRNQSVANSSFQFKCGESDIEYTDKYKYLGLVLNEHLDYSVTAKYVAQSATRALGLLISKFKQMGGMPYDVFTKLFDTTVWSVISYGAAIWGVKEYSVINTVQHKACRFFLGVGKYTPNAAVNGDMGWAPPTTKQWKSVLCHWFRLNHMDNNRINKQIFLWSHNTRHKYRNRCLHIERTMQKFDKTLNIGHFYSKSERQSVIKSIQDNMFNEYKNDWLNKVNSNMSISRNNGGNKLRTYKLYKSSYETEHYVRNHIMSRARRSALAKFRCGVAPLRIETGRYERLSLDKRICFNCTAKVENEEHVLLECPLYNDIRRELFGKIEMPVRDFHALSNSDKVCHLLSDNAMVNYSAKACHDILTERRKYLYS